jgi:hypothetical protein
VTASDADQPAQTLTYSIAGGADAARFSIDAATGALRFVAAPDYEAPSDAGTDNVYDVTVQVSDGAWTDTQALAVTVTAVNDNAPQFGSVGTDQPRVVLEGEPWSSVLAAADADQPAQTLTFRIQGGADAALFMLDPSSGLLAFKRVADHEAPQDADRNNVYEVDIEVSDGELSASRTVALQVINRNEVPVLVNSQMVVQQGGRVALDSEMLLTRDVDTTPAALVYTVSDVRSGVFQRIDAPGVPVNQFTQADVDAGRVVFVQSGVQAMASFALAVSDGDWSVGPRLVVVQVQPEPEQVSPPKMSVDFAVPPATVVPGYEAVAPVLPLTSPLPASEEHSRHDPAAHATKPGTSSMATSDRDGEILQSRLVTLTRAATVSRGALTDPPQSSPRAGLIPEIGRGLALEAGRQTTSELLVMLDVPIDLSGFVQERMSLLQWGSADERTRVEAEAARHQQTQEERPALHWGSGQAVQIGSMALSVSLVFWATRATGLVASLLAVAPPWRAFDPLPVLSVHAPRQPEGTEVEWLDTDITGSLAELAEDILDQRP